MTTLTGGVASTANPPVTISPLVNPEPARGIASPMVPDTRNRSGELCASANRAPHTTTTVAHTAAAFQLINWAHPSLLVCQVEGFPRANRIPVRVYLVIAADFRRNVLAVIRP